MRTPIFDSKLAAGLPRCVLIALLGLQVMVCCSRTRERVLQCCAAGLLDAGKLLQANRPEVSSGIMTLTHEYAPHQGFDLATLLRQPAPQTPVWIVNGSQIKGPVLQFDAAPASNSVLIYSIEAHREGEQQSDGFQLVLLPAGANQRFSAWLAQERQDLRWLKLLPPAYSSLGPGMSNPEPKNCGRLYWEDVHKLETNFHPGGAYEMRSRAVGDGHGHQAVYDAAGKLIREGLGAGSADKGTPRLWGFGLMKHLDRDVRPFVWAAQLDGNPVNAIWLYRDLNAPLVRLGDHVKAYQSVRPALANQPSEVPAGTCITRTN